MDSHTPAGTCPWIQNYRPRRQTGCLCPDGSRRLIGECRLTLALDMPALAEGLTLWRGDPSDSRGRFGGGAVPLGEQRKAPLRLYGMGTLWIAGVLLLAVCLGACSDQSPMAVESESGHLESAAQAESGARPGAAATVDPSETREREGDAAQAVVEWREAWAECKAARLALGWLRWNAVGWSWNCA